MRTWLILAPIALVGPLFVLSAQTTRPAPTVIRPMPQPQVANPTGGAGRTEAMIAELQRQIDAANSKIAAQANTIELMKNQVQKIAIGGFANKGDVSALAARIDAMAPAIQTLQLGARDTGQRFATIESKASVLRSDYDQHTHRAYYERDENDNNKIVYLNTTCPGDNLQPNPNPSSPSIRDKVICVPKPK